MSHPTIQNALHFWPLLGKANVLKAITWVGGGGNRRSAGPLPPALQRSPDGLQHRQDAEHHRWGPVAVEADHVVLGDAVLAEPVGQLGGLVVPLIRNCFALERGRSGNQSVTCTQSWTGRGSGSKKQ